MAHALDRHAEKAYAELDATRQQQICEKLFKALTDKATDPRGVRRPTTLGELCALADASRGESRTSIAVFRDPSRSFLMPPAGEALDGDGDRHLAREPDAGVATARQWQLDEEASPRGATAAWPTRQPCIAAGREPVARPGTAPRPGLAGAQ